MPAPSAQLAQRRLPRLLAWLLGGVAIGALLLGCALIVQLRNAVVGGGLAGLGVLAGGALSWWQLRYTIRHGQQQLEQVRRAQITERLTHAIDQLGNDKPEIAVAGIYALERIALDAADEYRATVAEMLTAHIRTHAPWPLSRPGQYVATAPLDQVRSLRERATTVQTALTVLDRNGFAETMELDLRSTDLRRADLEGARFPGVNLQGANLAGANLQGANLEGAYLPEVDLRHATLIGANLQHANLEGAHLQDAHLFWAHLQEACLGAADLQRADLDGANLQYAELWSANLQGANLRGADLQRADLHHADLQGAILADKRQREDDLDAVFGGDADLREASLKGATADGRTRWPKGFDRRAAGVRLQRRGN